MVLHLQGASAEMKVTKVLLEQKVTVAQLYEILISGGEALENNVFVLDSLSKLEQHDE